MLDKRIIAASVVLLAAATTLAACDDGRAYFAKSQNDCVAHVSQFVMDRNRRRIPDSLIDDFEKMNRRMAVSACEVIVSECQPHPNGEICRKLVSDYL